MELNCTRVSCSQTAPNYYTPTECTPTSAQHSVLYTCFEERFSLHDICESQPSNTNFEKCANPVKLAAFTIDRHNGIQLRPTTWPRTGQPAVSFPQRRSHRRSASNTAQLPVETTHRQPIISSPQTCHSGRTREHRVPARRTVRHCQRPSRLDSHGCRHNETSKTARLSCATPHS